RSGRRLGHLSAVLFLLVVGCSRNQGPLVGPMPDIRMRDVDVIDADELTIPISSMERLISNRLPGIVIRRTRGGYPSIQIRGSSSFSSTNEALIVVDGRVIRTADFFNLNPADVGRIEVLRGPNA